MACLAHRREDRIQTVKQVVQQLARAIAIGPSLMSYMAPHLVDDQIAPTAITISDGIGPAVTQWAEAQLAGRERGSRSRLGALAMVLCGVIAPARSTPTISSAGAPASPRSPVGWGWPRSTMARRRASAASRWAASESHWWR